MSSHSESASQGALQGIRVFDMSRILAGPTCTQLLGDLGADVIKVEKPGSGDDTRKWGPPYVVGVDGADTTESAYYLAANRNKRSLHIDFATEAGRRTALSLIAHCDVLIENYKTGTLAKYGLDHESLRGQFPRLIYCSITGFGQTGPYANRAGYDFLAQAMGGIMSLTGTKDGPPMKVGVGIADITTGLYATIGILGALVNRQITGLGQHIDVSLLDTQVSWLANEATNYLLSGKLPVRRGNEHPNIVPYKVYQTADGHIVLAVGNDSQFERWCALAGVPRLSGDARFATNANRVINREALEPEVEAAMRIRTTANWITALEKVGIPCGPVNAVDQVFRDPHILSRGMKIEMPYPHGRDGRVQLLGNPLHLSRTPVSYRKPPPVEGEHTEEILSEFGLRQ